MDEFQELYQLLARKYRLSPNLPPVEGLRAKAKNMQEMLDSEIISATLIRQEFEEEIKFLNGLADLIEKISKGKV